MTEQGPPAGWYPSKAMADTVRYWDGAKWTNQLAPAGAAAPATVAPVGAPAKASDGLIVAAYVLAALMPLIGLIVGIVVAAKGSAGHGVAAILIAGVLMTLYLANAGLL